MKLKFLNHVSVFAFTAAMALSAHNASASNPLTAGLGDLTNAATSAVTAVSQAPQFLDDAPYLASLGLGTSQVTPQLLDAAKYVRSGSNIGGLASLDQIYAAAKLMNVFNSKTPSLEQINAVVAGNNLLAKLQSGTSGAANVTSLNLDQVNKLASIYKINVDNVRNNPQLIAQIQGLFFDFTQAQPNQPLGGIAQIDGNPGDYNVPMKILWTNTDAQGNPINLQTTQHVFATLSSTIAALNLPNFNKGSLIAFSSIANDPAAQYHKTLVNAYQSPAAQVAQAAQAVQK